MSVESVLWASRESNAELGGCPSFLSGPSRYQLPFVTIQPILSTTSLSHNSFFRDTLESEPEHLLRSIEDLSSSSYLKNKTQTNKPKANLSLAFNWLGSAVCGVKEGGREVQQRVRLPHLICFTVMFLPCWRLDGFKQRGDKQIGLRQRGHSPSPVRLRCISSLQSTLALLYVCVGLLTRL